MFDDSLYEGPVPETFSFDVRAVADNIGGVSIVHIVDDEGECSNREIDIYKYAKLIPYSLIFKRN